jgi:hypothetical protein
MEERKTAAVVLGIIALIVVFFVVTLPGIRFRGVHTLSFKSCTVHFKYDHAGLESDIYRAAQNKLALCLCKVYQQTPDTAIANHIMQNYRQYGAHDNLYFHSTIDSVIKHKNEVLDTLILVD